VGSVIGGILPLALGIAISPVPIIAAILMLLSPRARSTSIGFLFGWAVGVVLVVVAFSLLSSILPDRGDASQPIAGGVQIALGVLLLLLAVRTWRARARDDAEPPMPKWMTAIDSVTPARGILLGFALAAVNPKNLLMGVAAGVAIGSGGLTFGESAIAVILFALVAASTVAVPVIAYLAASDRMATPLESLRQWLVHNNDAIMAVLLLVIGVVLVGKGIGSF
jgi:threonine/homoserine/homoserine lactone efflux protein